MIDEIIKKALELWPQAEVQEDDDGQIVIYTGIREEVSYIIDQGSDCEIPINSASIKAKGKFTDFERWLDSVETYITETLKSGISIEALKALEKLNDSGIIKKRILYSIHGTVWSY